MSSVSIPQTRYEVPAPGAYVARVDDVTMIEDGPYGRQVQVTFTIAEGPCAGTTVKKWCNAVFGPKSSLFEMVKSILGKDDLPRDLGFTDDLIKGRTVGVVLKHKTTASGQYAKIESFYPAQSAAGRPASPGNTPPANNPAGSPSQAPQGGEQLSLY